MPRGRNSMARNDDTKLLIAVFRQWEPFRIDMMKIGEELGIRPGAASMRWSRFKARLNTGMAPIPADYELLVAVITRSDRLPRLDMNRLGEDLCIRSGAAAMRWARFKAKIGIQNRNQTRKEETSKGTNTESYIRTPSGKNSIPTSNNNETTMREVESGRGDGSIGIETEGANKQEIPVVGWYNEAGWP